MDPQSIYLWIAAICGFLMAWGIGANDVSNAMGTSVGSKAITIRQAIVIAAIFEFLGAFLAGSEVTNTIRKNIVDLSLLVHTPNILVLGMLSSLMAAACWLFIASFFGWPVSTTHTIVGAIIGFGAAKLGIDAIKWANVLSILLGWVLSPVLGAACAFSLFISCQKFIFNKKYPFKEAKNVAPYYIFFCSFIILILTCSSLYSIGINITYWQGIFLAILISIFIAIASKFAINKLKFDPKENLKSHYVSVEKIFSILMVFTACAMAFAHGSNDVANAIGPLAAIAGIVSNPENIDSTSIVPLWILLLGASGIVMGLSMYGYKVIATIGNKITYLTPSRGFSATLATATTVVFASAIGIPISTTHTMVGGILGVGLARGIHAINLNMVKNIFISWIITLPIGAIFAIIFYNILDYFLSSIRL